MMDGNMTDIQVKKPKYQQIYEDLLLDIANENYALNEKLPSEAELCKKFEVSRITLRKSLDLLVENNVLSRRQGSGYIVISLKVQSKSCLISFTDLVIKSGRIPTTRMLDVKYYLARSQNTLSLPKSLQKEQSLVLIKRLRLIDNQPVLAAFTWIPERLVEGITLDDFKSEGYEQSMHYVLKHKFDLDLKCGSEELMAVLPSEEVAGYLEVTTRHPVLQQICTIESAQGELILYEEVYRTDKISFETGGLNDKQKTTK